MGQKSVAVLDIRSSDITVVVGERGVNHTFVFKAMHTEPYDGYEDGKFYDEKQLSEAVYKAVTGVEQICGERLKHLYIGVPGMFTEVVPKEESIGFPRKRRIGSRETTALFEKGKKKIEGYRFMRTASMIYTTSDDRRVVDPTGLSSSTLSGILSYFYCSEYFAGEMEKIFDGMKITLSYIPSEYATACYLIPSETRDECAIFLDAGFLASTVSILFGSGVLLQKTCWIGRGQIAGYLVSEFDLPYEAALQLLSKANLYSKDNAGDFEFFYLGKSYTVNGERFVGAIKDGLDELCEAVSNFLEEHAAKELDYKPIYVTGDGVNEIRGALEHITKRLSRPLEAVSPKVPSYSKPSMSSRIALVDMACSDQKKNSFLSRILGL